jgi:hypothetical protein
MQTTILHIHSAEVRPKAKSQVKPKPKSQQKPKPKAKSQVRPKPKAKGQKPSGHANGRLNNQNILKQQKQLPKKYTLHRKMQPEARSQKPQATSQKPKEPEAKSQPNAKSQKPKASRQPNAKKIPIQYMFYIYETWNVCLVFERLCTVTLS